MEFKWCHWGILISSMTFMMDSNPFLNTTMLKPELSSQNQLELIVTPVPSSSSVSLPPQEHELAFTDFTWNSVMLTELVVRSHALIGFNEGIFCINISTRVCHLTNISAGKFMI